MRGSYASSEGVAVWFVAPLHRGFLAAVAACWITMAVGNPARADSTPQVLPFLQSWSNPDLITSDDNWSGVPGVVGIRGDNLTPGTATDPQTILEEEFTLDVIANQSNPASLTNGGIAEFDGLADRAVALQGSGAADAPYIQITVTTAGVAVVRVAYTLRDVDGSADNTIQPVALQYRVGFSGSFTNVPGAFVADATTGPGLATLETRVSVVLPPQAGNQDAVQLRIITANASGNDEWVAVDDILVADAMTSPTGAGSAYPSAVEPGGVTRLVVAVTPGTYPQSTSITVSCDLSSIGGPSSQSLHDDGTHGDDMPGDAIFTYEAVVAEGTTPGSKSLTVVIADAEGRSSGTEVALTVLGTVGVPGGKPPAGLALYPPFPNPFRSGTSIAFEIPAPTRVSIAVFDLQGRLVAVLENSALLPAGRHQVRWTGRDEAGRRVASGAYICRIVTERDQASARLLLVH